MWYIVDTRTNAIVGAYKNRKRAQTRADKLDNTFGAYRYTVRGETLQSALQSALAKMEGR